MFQVLSEGAGMKSCDDVLFFYLSMSQFWRIEKKK